MRKLIQTCFVILISMLGSRVNGPVCAQEAPKPSATEKQEAPKPPAAEKKDEFQQAFDSARDLGRQGRIEEAINEYQRAAKLRDGKCPECFQIIGQIWFQFGRYKEAAEAFRQCAELKPSNEAEIYNVLGVVLYLQKEKDSYEAAVTALQRAIELSKGKLSKPYYNLGFALIKLGKEQEGIAALKRFLELEPGATEASQARAMISNTRMIDAKVAPSFAVKSHTGDDLTLEKLRGRVVLLEFWASWCTPCRIDLPEVRKIWTKYGGDRFVIIGINLDSDRQAFDAYMKEESITWPQYYDGLGWGNKISQLYGVYSIPHTVVIDQDGVIQATGARGDELSEKIGELLKKLPGSGEKSSKGN